MENILVAVDSKKDSHLIVKLLKHNYDISAYEEGMDSVSRFDLIITDSKMLSSFKKLKAGFNNGTSPVFLPILLVSSKKEINTIPTDRWQLVDEVITTPLSRMELFSRAELLLRARRQSAELCLQKEKMDVVTGDGFKYGRIIDCFANASHELRTPLAVILESIELLSVSLSTDRTIPDNYRETLDISKRNCYRLLRIINNLLDLNRIDSGSMPLNLKNVDLHEALQNIVDNVQVYAGNKQITLSFISDAGCRNVAVDEDMLGRIMLNLISNAIKFTPPRGIVTVVLQDGHNKDKVIISVRDNGIGIPSEKQSAIFDRFVQVDNTMSKRKEGCGLGLTIARSLAEMHGGRIWVESRPGTGSKFSFELPAATTADPAHVCISDIMDRAYYEFSDI